MKTKDYTPEMTALIEDVISDDYDDIEKPKHYNTGEIETFDYIVDVLGEWGAIHYCWGNIIKYTGSRFMEKGIPTSNGKKAIWYLRKMVDLLDKTEGKNW